MLGTKDIEKVMIGVCEGLGIYPLSQIFVKDDFPNGVGDRIVIHVKPQMRGEVFYKGFVEVNVVVSDILGANGNYRADHDSINEVEQTLDEAFRYDTVGEYEGQTYRYGLNSLETINEPDSHYHYVNARLTFETLNI